MSSERGRRLAVRIVRIAVVAPFSVALTGATTSTASTAAPPRLAPFASSVARVTAGEIRYLWHPGCPVGPAALRMVHLRYVGFDGQVHDGEMIVNVAVVPAVVTVFHKLFEAHFPIREMVTEESFGGSDPASMAADNTSGFNCRYAVAPGPPQWSVHAYGEAIDVNTVENPYVEGGTVMPTAGRAYLDRTEVRPGMAVPGGTLVDAFASVGWYWGGRWTSSPDYQHFSATGG